MSMSAFRVCVCIHSFRWRLPVISQISIGKHFASLFRSNPYTITRSSSRMANVPMITFNNGLNCPQLGLGTWKSKPGEVSEAVFQAIEIGYRHIDCALVYQNEKEVGQGIGKALQKGICKREDLFITTKLWNTFHKDELVVPSLKQSLDNLKLTYVDLYLIHWPQAYKEGGELFPVDANNKTAYSTTSYLETWKAMERCVQQGLAKSIGVSNFNSKQLAKVLEIATIKPVTNQVECHPYLIQKKLKAYLDSVGITLTAYSPLGSPDRPWAKPDEQPLLANEKLNQIAQKYNKTAAQIALRWQFWEEEMIKKMKGNAEQEKKIAVEKGNYLNGVPFITVIGDGGWAKRSYGHGMNSSSGVIEKGNIVIPKSVTKSRIESNIQIFDFSLKPEDIEAIDKLDCNARMVGLEAIKDHPDYPFNEEF